MNGIPVEDHIGRNPGEIVPDFTEQVENTLKEILRTGETLQVEFIGETPAHPEVKRYYDETWSPLRDPSGNITGISVVAVDITARKRALEDLQKINCQKNNFISLLSHELRNPIAALTMALSLLERSTPFDELSRNTFDVANRQAKQLSRLVDDLLDVTRINRNYIELKKEYLDINELIRQTIVDYRKFFGSKGIIFDFECDMESIHIFADPARIAQVLGNLLHNAVKFSSDGGRITIKAEIDITKQEQNKQEYSANYVGEKSVSPYSQNAFLIFCIFFRYFKNSKSSSKDDAIYNKISRQYGNPPCWQ
jgi:signal transduction histidine kinase